MLAVVALLALLAVGVIAHERQQTAEQLATNTELLEQLEAATHILCRRGFILIDVIDAAILLVEQRLEDDVKSGNTSAVHADQLFLAEFSVHKERLITEQTSLHSPCALP